MSKSLSDRIEAGEFDSNSLFPTEENLANDVMWQEAHKKQLALLRKLAAVKTVKEQIVQRMKKEYREDTYKKRRLFLTACEYEYGTEKWPAETRENLFNKAWEDGHAYGYSEVASHYADLADFITHSVIGAFNE